MLKNYFRTAIRSLMRSKMYTLINVFGLAISITASLLIFQYIEFESGYDKFHDNYRHIYRLVHQSLRGEESQWEGPKVSPAVGPAMKRDFPEVVDFARVLPAEGRVAMSYRDNVFSELKLYYADPSFFSIFSFEVVKGDAGTALAEPNTLAVSASIARKYFHNEDPLGKTIQMSYGQIQVPFRVTAVFEDVPANSHVKFDFLASFSTWERIAGGNLNNVWNSGFYYTYLALRPGVNHAGLESKLPAFVQKYMARPENDGFKDRMYLQPLAEIHLHSNLAQELEINGSSRVVYFMVIIAVFILFIAWINYVNLSTARAMERAKEVGLRKALGALQDQLVKQFLFESAITNAIAIATAVVLLCLAIPYFNDLAGLPPAFTVLTRAWFWFTIAGLFVLGILMSGLYPSIVLASYEPIAVLKGKLRNSTRGIVLRKGLVVFQFAASVFLIIGTVAVYSQLKYMRNQDLKMNIDQILVLDAPTTADSTYKSKLKTFKEELVKLPGIKSMTSSIYIPGKFMFGNGGIRRAGGEENNYFVNNVDYDFIKSFRMKILAGRDFEKARDAEFEKVIINETAVKLLGFKSPEAAIDQTIFMFDGSRRIVGVVKNYNQYSLKEEFPPIIMQLSDSDRNYYSIKLDTQNASTERMENTVASVKRVWDMVFPGNPFGYFFLDDFYNEQYKTENYFGKMFAVFAALAVMIACFGLFGLSSFTAVQRTKEIGVRKVLGASTPNIILLLLKDFTNLILLANVIAWPLAYWAVSRWLNGFVFRISPSWELFVLPGLLLLVIAVLTVIYQTVKAAGARPVKALSSE